MENVFVYLTFTTWIAWGVTIYLIGGTVIEAVLVTLILAKIPNDVLNETLTTWKTSGQCPKMFIAYTLPPYLLIFAALAKQWRKTNIKDAANRKKRENPDS